MGSKWCLVEHGYPSRCCWSLPPGVLCPHRQAKSEPGGNMHFIVPTVPHPQVFLPLALFLVVFARQLRRASSLNLFISLRYLYSPSVMKASCPHRFTHNAIPTSLQPLYTTYRQLHRIIPNHAVQNNSQVVVYSIFFTHNVLRYIHKASEYKEALNTSKIHATQKIHHATQESVRPA